METASYRDVLKKHFADRLESNPRYSLRAFSRDLHIGPSRLSEILSGKQGLSGEWAGKIAQRLQLSKSEAEEFRTRVLAADGRAKRTRQAALERLEDKAEPRTLELDAFLVISDWYYYALLELTRVKGFKAAPAWIGRRLGLTEYEAKLAIERLVRLGLLEQKRGTLKATNVFLTTTNGVPSEAIRKFNRQVLDRAREAIALQTVEERDISSLTVAVRRSDIPVVKERIRKFRRELNAELEASVAGRGADEVYSLAIQFFRLTVKEKP